MHPCREQYVLFLKEANWGIKIYKKTFRHSNDSAVQVKMQIPLDMDLFCEKFFY